MSCILSVVHFASFMIFFNHIHAPVRLLLITCTQLNNCLETPWHWLKASVTYLNWIMYALTARHRMECAISLRYMCHVNTDWQQLHTSSCYNTTGQDLMWCRVYHECVLSLRWPLPFNTRGLGWTDGQTDKNRQMITSPIFVADLVLYTYSLIKKEI